MEAIILAIVQNVVVPELARFIQRKFSETGKIPTKEEMIAYVVEISDEIIAKGTMFAERLKQDAQTS